MLKNKKFLSISIISLLLIVLSFFVFFFFFEKASREPEEVFDHNGSQLFQIERNIKDVFMQKYPEWKEDSVSVSIKKKYLDYAVGEITHDDRRGKLFWFSKRIDSQWKIISSSGGGYFGICQNFKDYNLPSKITPDCWDNKNFILQNSPNPSLFYDGLTVDDKEKIKKVFLEYTKDNIFYRDKELYVKFNEVMGNYLRGSILVGGVENHSSPQFFAVKSGIGWVILYFGQENPPCINIKSYNFPVEIISSCWDGESEIERK